MTDISSFIISVFHCRRVNGFWSSFMGRTAGSDRTACPGVRGWVGAFFRKYVLIRWLVD